MRYAHLAVSLRHMLRWERSKIVLSLFLAASPLILFSCADNTDNQFVGFEMLSDEVVEGEAIEFRFTLADRDNRLYNRQQLFAEVCFSPSSDGAYQRDTVIRLSSNLEGEIIIPRKTAAVSIELSTKETILNYFSGLFIVYNKELMPVRKARTYQLWYDHLMPKNRNDKQDKKLVESLFNAERENYPDDVSIFFCRWLYESKTGALDTAVLRKDLAVLSKYRGNAAGDAMLSLGSFFHTIAERQAHIKAGDNNSSASMTEAEFRTWLEQYRLPDEIIRYNNNPIFDEPWFVNWLKALRGIEYLASSKWNGEKQAIIGANPVSMYTKGLFLQGSYYDIAPDIALAAAESLLSKTGYPLYKYYKMRILNQFYPSRRAECFALVNELKAIVQKGTYYAESLDPGHFFDHNRFQPYLVEGELLVKEGLYDSALSVLRDARKMIDDPWDITHAMVLSQCSECFLRKGDVDSSTKYMVAAAIFAPGQPSIQDTLHARYNRANTKLDYNSWIRSIEQTTPDGISKPLPKSMRKLVMSNGVTLDFRNIGDTLVIMECWSAGCSLCTMNLKDANEYSKQHRSGKVKVFIATKDESELDKLKKKQHIDLPSVRKGTSIINDLGIHTYPTTIVIKNGRIIGRYTSLQSTESIVDMSR